MNNNLCDVTEKSSSYLSILLKFKERDMAEVSEFEDSLCKNIHWKKKSIRFIILRYDTGITRFFYLTTKIEIHVADTLLN